VKADPAQRPMGVQDPHGRKEVSFDAKMMVR
jgi:hypothetical protein